MNTMVYFRGSEADFNKWEELGNPNWEWENVVKYFRKSMTNGNPEFIKYENGKFHGGNGPVPLEHFKVHDNFSQVIIDAAKEMGYDYVDDVNAGARVGYSFAQATIKDGARSTTAKHFLGKGAKRHNLHVIKHAHVLKVEFDKKNLATGVRFKYENKEIMAYTKKEVILSAGSIGSTQLLMLSGIGPKAHLEEMNIPVRLDLPVGQNLQDHIQIPLFFQIHKSNPRVTTVNDQLEDYVRYLTRKEGPFAGVGLFDLIGLINTVNRTGDPDVEFQHDIYKKSCDVLKTILEILEYKEPIVQSILKANSESEILFIEVQLLRPKSVGKIELRSSDSYDKPVISPNYLENEEDMKTVIRGIKYTMSFVKTKAFAKHEASLVRVALPACDKFEYESDEYWDCYVRHMVMTIYHAIGTSKMGPESDEEAVVDPTLMVRGTRGLRVVDASIMPQMISANINAAVVMIGEKGADLIKEDWKIETGKLEL